jgi:hypothetical protein
MYDLMPTKATMTEAPDFLAAGGEMGHLIRGHDWARTSLGPPEQWPTSLKVVVRILLASHEPLAVWWGGGATLLYNDACRDLIGREHPTAFGGPVPEKWLDGRAGLRLSLHPVPGEHGQLGGVLCTFANAVPTGDGA